MDLKDDESEQKKMMIEMMIPVILKKSFWDVLYEIDRTAKELDIDYAAFDNIVYFRGKYKNVKAFEASLLQKLCVVSAAIDDEKRKIKQKPNKKRTDTEFVIPADFTKEDVEVEAKILGGI